MRNTSIGRDNSKRNSGMRYRGTAKSMLWSPSLPHPIHGKEVPNPFSPAGGASPAWTPRCLWSLSGHHAPLLLFPPEGLRWLLSSQGRTVPFPSSRVKILDEGTTRRGTATPVHRPQRPAGSTHSSTRVLRPPEQLERQAGFPSSHPDDPVS